MKRLPRKVGEQALRWLLARSLAGMDLGLCLHRVSPTRREEDWLPEMTIEPDKLDRLLDFILSSRPRGGRPWLVATFDDGYEDALEYVASRAPRHPDVDWIYFVCPRKTEERVGFRWDLVSAHRAGGERVADPAGVVFGPADVVGENEREDLRLLARRPDYRLAELPRIRELGRLPNVHLGNHTNGHFVGATLERDDARLEYGTSIADFERLFGEHHHFALPFGGPREHFDEGHIEVLRSLGNFVIWSTESRPFRASERRDGAVLPRLAVNGARSWPVLVLVITLRALKYRLLGTRHRWPLPAGRARDEQSAGSRLTAG